MILLTSQIYQLFCTSLRSRNSETYYALKLEVDKRLHAYGAELNKDDKDNSQ